MKWNHYLPSLHGVRLRKEGVSPVWYRWSRSLLPGGLKSGATFRAAGKPRRLLRRLGATWEAAPVRRGIQTACFLLFLWLFFSVCWPYGATPAQLVPGWVPQEVDGQSGKVTLVSDLSTESFRKGQAWHVLDASAMDVDSGYLGLFQIETIQTGTLVLNPVSRPDATVLQWMMISFGPWTLSEELPGTWPDHYAQALEHKTRIAPEAFLVLDPLVALSTALAARSWVSSLLFAGLILAICVLIPRGFCGYLCPLGTLIDLFDWGIASRFSNLKIPDNGWWVHLKYYLLTGVMIAALCGVLLSGFVSAIPVLTRGMLYLFDPVQTGFMLGWHQVPSMHLGHWFSIGLFLLVLGLGFLRPRFWCRYVCPSGAIFSLANVFRWNERKVSPDCIHCNKCVTACPFDAIKPDFTTRTTDCTLCQTCGGVCPTEAIQFVPRLDGMALKLANVPPANETALGRRGFLATGIGMVAGVVGGVSAGWATKSFGARLDDQQSLKPVRPPGSVEESRFLEICIRCGECFKVCPNHVLQPLAFEQGLEGLWTPYAELDWAGCDSSCNACGQVCPTEAILPLPLEEKRVTKMGLAIVDSGACLPHVGAEACQLCVDECRAAGYQAIEFTRVRTERADGGMDEWLAPVVLGDKCVGCGLCQMRCYQVNVKDRQVLELSAIVVETGEGREDRA
jgi:ferredoxin-type protein NapF